MTAGPNDASLRIQAALDSALRAASAGDTAAADRHWREYVGLLELSMGRTGSVERLTPEIKREDRT